MAREMKDSGIAWIGEIPKDWKLDKVIRLFQTIGSGTTPKTSDDTNFDGNINWIQSGDINGGILRDATKKISIDIINKYSALKVYKSPFIIVAMYGASVGNISISEIDGCVNQACCVLSNPNQSFDYLFYCIKSAQDFLIYRAEGGGQPNVSQDKIKSLWLPLPKFKEQQTIANFLDKKCSEIDELISLQENMIDELKAYKQSVITEAVTKGLDSNVELKDSGVDWIGEIPMHWETRRIKNIGNAKNGLTYSPQDVVGEDEGVLVLRSSNIQNGKITFDDNIFVSCKIPQTLMVNKGDLIICSRNGSASLVGKCALIEDDNLNATYGAFMMRFQSIYHHKYIYYLLTCAISQYKQLFSTTTINQLTVGVFGGLIMPFANSSQEQNEIAIYLETKCDEIDALISIKQKKIESLKDYKKSLIYEYVTGKKQVV